MVKPILSPSRSRTERERPKPNPVGKPRRGFTLLDARRSGGGRPVLVGIYSESSHPTKWRRTRIVNFAKRTHFVAARRQRRQSKAIGSRQRKSRRLKAAQAVSRSRFFFRDLVKPEDSRSA